MNKNCKKLMSTLIASAISISMAATCFAQEYFNENTIPHCEHSEECGELGYIPDDSLGTPAVFSSPDRSFGYIFYQYPDQSYFSKTGTACKCHSYCNWKSNCDCINFENSIQCMAFAKKVYYETNGHSLPGLTTKNIYLSAADAKNLFNHRNTSPEATYLRVRTKSGYDHSIIIVFSSNNDVTVYHANYGGPCLVRYESYTWESFAEAFPYLYGYAT